MAPTRPVRSAPAESEVIRVTVRLGNRCCKLQLAFSDRNGAAAAAGQDSQPRIPPLEIQAPRWDESSAATRAILIRRLIPSSATGWAKRRQGTRVCTDDGRNELNEGVGVSNGPEWSPAQERGPSQSGITAGLGGGRPRPGQGWRASRAGRVGSTIQMPRTLGLAARSAQGPLGEDIALLRTGTAPPRGPACPSQQPPACRPARPKSARR